MFFFINIAFFVSIAGVVSVEVDLSRFWMN